MLSKFLLTARRCSPSVANRVVGVCHPVTVSIRRKGYYIPPTQYDMPWPKRLTLLYAMSVNWEIIPLFTVTGIVLFILFYSIYWATNNKVDVVFTSRNRSNISRTMDLRNPSIHKLVIINQRYEPWPEMQDVLDKMTTAEKRELVRLQMCASP